VKILSRVTVFVLLLALAGCGNSTSPGTPALVTSPPVVVTPAAATVNFAANTTNITSGTQAVLTWSTTNATSVAITPDPGVGALGLFGILTVQPTQTTTYAITANGQSGTPSATAKLTINITAELPPPTPTPAPALGKAEPPSDVFGLTEIDLVFRRTFIGLLECINCIETDPVSINNPNGIYGNFGSTTSVWNQFSAWGSEFGQFSACNPLATNPPVVYNHQTGAFIGELTVNQLRLYAIQDADIVNWLQTSVCKHK
jgi:hypothetical protein